MRLLIGTVVTVLVLGVAAAVYVRIGWSRMEAHCDADPRLGAHGGQVEFSWSWKPTGFTCTYRDGHIEHSLWF